MKGSYSVAIGSSRSPLMACDSPSADIRMNRFISAMPSSMCCPFGEKSQLKVEGIFSLRNRSAFSARANSPRRLTQAPRLVDTVTSGDAVTMRDGQFGVAAREFVEHQPKALLGRHLRRRLEGQLLRAPRSRARSDGGGLRG